MSQNRKIIIVGTVASSLYIFRKDLILSLIDKEFIVYAFTSDNDPKELDKIAKLGAIPSHYQLSRGGLNPYEDISNTIKLYQQIKNIQPDIVFSYFIKPVIYGTLAAKMAKVPKKVAMIEGLGSAFTEYQGGSSIKMQMVRKVQISLFKLALPLADKVIFLNPDDPKDLLIKNKIKNVNCTVLGGIGLNLKDYEFTQIDLQQPIKFIFIARLLKEKGIFEFVEAAKIVKQKYPQTIFTVLGSIDTQSLGAMKQHQLDELIASNLIEYPGHVNNVNEWIAKSHVFVLPSFYREGVPRSTQEAMAVGRAVITTDVPGCRETVVDGVNGFLVPKWNPQALAEKMIYLIENPKKIVEMGQESYKIAQEKFDARKVNERLLKILGI
ncbi:glycosyltransferase family 1 protein [Moraxella osloensis]|uniref:Glycosyltransferase family 1 protein n=1 Tax=Faucicola osloensis TaxID=34062 RepID=A0AAD0EYE9_FAUOS|nr:MULTISPECIES: glycosyltransferase family 4 protein [Moraxella]ATQ83450.1 glycosyltransferase family 1 protein [Moraxella osloensis]ATW85944.1 glycosyltransferase family 1 protein [Moraxella osloensis]